MATRVWKWLVDLVREVRGNALWDLVKLIVILAFGLILVVLYRLAAWLRGIPQDRIIDLGIFVTAVLLMAAAYLLSRRRLQSGVLPSQTVYVPVPMQPTMRVAGSRQPGRMAAPANPIFVNVDVLYLMGLCVGRTGAEGQRLVAPYTGKWIQHSGAVSDVHEYSDRTEIVMRVEDVPNAVQRGLLFINGYEREWKDRASILRIGDTVTIKGEIESVAANVIFIVEAAFIEDKNDEPRYETFMRPSVS